ncbi:F-box domain-containing protein [Mycena chlorophos]|uniref:F-box domain-containing protein n=1 Tax=Mycena chlorophos TaxID=658473 RepID=A0A8H6WM63_MYCCL|nr:F-box domain-containing protein [Mycena chlorophos]
MSLLPNELCDRIIAELHNEPASLAKCALVARSWVTASQRALFSTLHINERNLSALTTHIGSEPSSVVRHVKHLHVHVWGDVQKAHQNRINRGRGASSEEEQHKHVLALLLPDLHHFKNVSELTLDCCRWLAPHKWDGAWTDPLAEAFPSLLKLNITYPSFETLSDFVDLVAAFRHLQHLTVDGVDVEEASHEYSNEPQDPYSGTKTPPPTLESISYKSPHANHPFRGCGGGPFLHWLAEHPGPFKTLRLNAGAEEGDVNAAVELIVAAAANLEELSVTFDDQWQMWDGLNLSLNTHLRKLVFPSGPDFVSELPQLIQSISSPLESITIGDIDQIDEEVWPEIVAALAAIPSLKKVAFCIGEIARDTGEERAREFAEEYPEFSERGIVVFEKKDRAAEW